MQTIEEIVLIGVDETALQAKMVLPPNPKSYAVLIHAPGGGRHDRPVKTAAKAFEGKNIGLLIPDLTDETEGWHGIKDEAFLIERAQAVIAWFLARAQANAVVVYAVEPTEGFVAALGGLPEVAEVRTVLAQEAEQIRVD